MAIVQLQEAHRYVKGILDVAAGTDIEASVSKAELLSASTEAESEVLADLMQLGYDASTWQDETDTPPEVYGLLERVAAAKIWKWAWLAFNNGDVRGNWEASLGAYLDAEAAEVLKRIKARGFVLSTANARITPTLTLGAPQPVPRTKSKRPSQVMATDEDLQQFIETYRPVHTDQTEVTMDTDPSGKNY